MPDKCGGEPRFSIPSGASYLWTQRVPLRLLNVPRNLLGAGLTLVARTVQNGVAYIAYGHYRSPHEYARLAHNKRLSHSQPSASYIDQMAEAASMDNSTLCMERQRCLGGTYSGVESQGLFWSMKQFPVHLEKRVGRMINKPAHESIDIRINAYDGFLPLNQILSLGNMHLEEFYHGDPLELTIRQLAGTSVRRSCLDPNRVKRIELTSADSLPGVGRIRGTLFCPLTNEHCQRHPPVLNLFGYGGGLLEHRAALLAHEGFLSLALAFYRFGDLPRQITHVDLDYFEEAINFLLSQQEDDVRPEQQVFKRISVVGLSKGADIAALLPSIIPDKIAGSVPINCMAHTVVHPNLYRGILSPPDLPVYETEHIHMSSFGVAYRSLFANRDHFVSTCADSSSLQSLPCHQPIPIIPVERCNDNTRYLFVYSTNDLSVDDNQCQILLDSLDRAGKSHQAELLQLPGAGHLLEPCDIPLTRKGFVTTYEQAMDYGGMPADHHRGQVLFWEKLIAFLRSVQYY